MYNKNELINKLSDAKIMHERWMSYAEAIYNGINISEEHTPLLHTECDFGKWLQSNGQLLYYVESPKSLQEDHKILHKVYMEMYKIMKDESKTNVFNKSRIEKKKKEALDKNFKLLNTISMNLVKVIDKLIEKIAAMSVEEIKELR